MNELILKIVQGNPGALTVCIEMMKNGERIDPDAAHPILSIFHLDALGLRGPSVWVLYKDVCGQNIARTLLMLRANQLGFLSAVQIHEAIDRARTLDFEALAASVKQELPAFNTAEAL